MSLFPADPFLHWIFRFPWMLENIFPFRGSTPSQAILTTVGQRLQLTTSKSVHIIIDTTEKILILKARGVSLRKFPLMQAIWIGDPIIHSTTIHLKTKHPLVSSIPIFPPSDFSSNFSSSKTKKSPVIHDMPLRYTLAFQENVTILVKAHHLPSFRKNLMQYVAGWGQRIKAKMSTWISSHQYLIISLDPAEAHDLYLAANPPMTCLVMPGPSTPK